MQSYLFLWNPTKDLVSFLDYDQVVANATAGQPYSTKWICRSRRPRPGDVAYMQRTGSKYNGIFARGEVTHGSHSGDDAQVVGLSLDEFLPVGSEIPRTQIITLADYEAPWSPMASGDAIPEQILAAIKELWPTSNSIELLDQAEPDATEAEELMGLEGELFRRVVFHRKRERYLRDSKIADVLDRTGALVCEVPGCDFDFARAYGKLGAGYAQVHHLFPLAQRDSAQTTLLSDLAIVCANCHAMIHRGGESRELLSLITSVVSQRLHIRTS